MSNLNQLIRLIHIQIQHANPSFLFQLFLCLSLSLPCLGQQKQDLRKKTRIRESRESRFLIENGAFDPEFFFFLEGCVPIVMMIQIGLTVTVSFIELTYTITESKKSKLIDRIRFTRFYSGIHRHILIMEKA
ncbi:hypothetical protein BCV73_16685 [Paenibacillus sp. SSG-1]|nr:hypothetical protein BCV73_16685 [Paenibacillus sp. SSG-1]